MSEEFEPRYRPKLPPPMRSIGVVHGVTVEQACMAFPKYNLEDRTFFCVTRGPGKPDACFTTGEPMPTYESIDSILGETTLEGVMRVLSIPRGRLVPE